MNGNDDDDPSPSSSSSSPSPQLSEPLIPDEDVALRNIAPATSRNITLTLFYTVFAYAGRSLWSQSVLSAFVFLLCDDNPEYVGFVTAVMGLFMLLASFPSGYLADKYRRDIMLKSASAAGVLAIAATSAAVYSERFDLLGGALAVWGIYYGMSDASLSALFADSMRDGDRGHYFTQRYILVKAGTLSGPAVALVMFAFLGNNWTAKDCAVVMAAGQALSLPAVILLCFFSDDFVVPHEEDGEVGGGVVTSRTAPGSRLIASSRSSLGETQATAVSSSSDCESDGNVDPAHFEETDAEERDHDFLQQEERPTLFCFCVPHERRIPALVAASDFTAGLAAGMSIRYFPLFFMDNLELSPVAVQILYALSPIGQAFLSKMALLVSKRLGRPQTTVLFKWTGIALMVTMIVGYTSHLPVPLVCAIFLLRDSFMNSTQALNKSLLMDAVPREERGKWSALESVNMFSWSGSAAVGGVLVMKKGLVFNFYVTAALQFLATLPLVMLFREVAMETTSPARVEGAESTGSMSEQSRGRGRRKTEDTDEEAANKRPLGLEQERQSANQSSALR